MNTAATIRPAPRLLRTLDPRDRQLLLVCLGTVVLVAVVLAIFTPPEDNNNPVPSTFSSTTRGAKAAYLTLAQSGYQIQRWEQPLSELPERSDANMVLILVEPGSAGIQSARAPIAKFLERGGHVLTTGLSGAALLPDNRAEQNPQLIEGDCSAQPEGFDPLSGSGVIHVRPNARWRMDLPNQRAQYICNGNAVVVTYPVGQGQVIWWANSLPLENAAIARDGDLALLLHSIGTSAGTRIIWDESLHEDQRGLWSYAEGTPVHLLWAQLALLALLLILSYSRRSGPLLPDPIVSRDEPLEFVHSLGALYDKAGATNTAVRIAYDRFRLLLGRPTGRQTGTEIADRADELVSAVNARLGHASPGLREDIVGCEEVSDTSDSLSARQALSLVRSLWQYEDEMNQGGRTRSRKSELKEDPSGTTEHTN